MLFASAQPMRRLVGTCVLMCVLRPAVSLAQPAVAGGESPVVYKPITSTKRVEWVVHGTASVPAVGIGLFNSAWMTATDWPREWSQNAGGFSRRYADGAAAGAISNSLEAGLGAFWGEDPRYIRSGRSGTWLRVRHAMTTVALAPRRDGHLAPAWGRLAGNVMGNAIENAWLPPSATTPKQTTVRIAGGLASRLISNIWDEFWPDLRQRLSTHGPSPAPER
jgi:hypothetical protein